MYVCIYVCVRVKGQKNINGQSNVSLYSSRAIRFRGARSSANQVSRGSEFSQSGFEGLVIRPIRFRGAGNSANQILRAWEISQSGFERLGIQPIRFGGAGNSTNQVSRGWEFSQSGFEGLGIQPIKFRGAESLTNHMGLVFWCAPIRESDGRTVLYNIRKVAVLLS